MRLFSVLVPRHRWLLAGCVTVAAGLGVFFALRNLPAHGASGAIENAARPLGVSEASLGFADSEALNHGRAGQQPPYEITGVQVERRHSTLRLTGSLAADEQSDVASNATGMVAEIRVDRGSAVRKGDVLIQLDPTDAKNRLDEGVALVEELKARLSIADPNTPFVAEDQPDVKLAKAATGLAKSRHQRAEVLLPQRAISLDDCEQIRADHQCAVERYEQALQQVRQTYQSYKTAVVRLAALRKAVADTTIRAPFDGIVTEKHVNVGEQVVSGFIVSKIITVVKIDPLRISLTVPQQSVGEIRVGQKVFFQVDSFPGKTFTAEVRYITPVLTEDTRTLVVEALTANPERILRPGMFVAAQLELPTERSEIFVPASAVERIGDSATVFLVQDGGLREQVVAVGQCYDGQVEILSGLHGGERLVTNTEKIRDGGLVRR
jgi:RND family efflux transporter MFP subunit